MIAFVLVNSKHGAILVNRFDYAKTYNDEFYGVGAQILENGAFDPEEVDVLKQLLSVRQTHYGKGVVALDCGANIGVHTLEFANHMATWGTVVAIEAQERIFYALAGNLALHNAFNARAIWAAVSDKSGYIEIAEPDYCTPSSFGSYELKDRLGAEFIGQEIDRSKPTSCVTSLLIDDIAFDRLDLLKMDIEGMEMEALAGSIETIEKFKPVLFIEAIKSDRKALTKFMEEHGYTVMPHGMNLLGIHKSDKTIENVSHHQRPIAA